MRKTLGIAAVALALGAVALPRCASALPDVVAPGAKWFGQTTAQWSVDWWKWVMAFPVDQSPMLDETGAALEVGQSGQVWFLTGTNGFVPPVTRTVHVPEGKSLLLPVINYLNDADPWNPDNPANPGMPPPGTSLEEWLMPTASFIIDHVTEMRMTLDGVEVPDLFDYRAQSRSFIFKADPSMVSQDPVVNPDGRPQPGVTDGYWVMFKPLSVGNHTLTSWGVCDIPEWGVSFAVDVTYNLIVEPRK